MSHRIVAALIAAGVIGYCILLRRGGESAIKLLRNLSAFWFFFLAGQITLGAWTIWSNKAADIATAHVAVGATMLALGVSICAIALRLGVPEQSVALASRSVRREEEAHAL